MTQDLDAAIKASWPFKYNTELYASVAEKLGDPKLPEDKDWRYKIYCRNRELEEIAFQERISAEGFIIATHEALLPFVNKKVEVLRGVGGLFGERIELATIKMSELGVLIALPPRARNKGYLPSYIRPVKTQKG